MTIKKVLSFTATVECECGGVTLHTFGADQMDKYNRAASTEYCDVCDSIGYVCLHLVPGEKHRAILAIYRDRVKTRDEMMDERNGELNRLYRRVNEKTMAITELKTQIKNAEEYARKILVKLLKQEKRIGELERQVDIHPPTLEEVSPLS